MQFFYTEKQFEKELDRRMRERERDLYMDDRFRRLEDQIDELRYPKPTCDVPNEMVRAHCNLEENARLIAQILDFDDEGKVFDWYEQHIAQAIDWYARYTVEKEDLTSKAVALYKANDTSEAESENDLMYRMGCANALGALLSKFGIDITKEVKRIGDEPDAADI